MCVCVCVCMCVCVREKEENRGYRRSILSLLRPVKMKNLLVEYSWMLLMLLLLMLLMLLLMLMMLLLLLLLQMKLSPERLSSLTGTFTTNPPPLLGNERTQLSHIFLNKYNWKM